MTYGYDYKLSLSLLYLSIFTIFHVSSFITRLLSQGPLSPIPFLPSIRSQPLIVIPHILKSRGLGFWNENYFSKGF